MYFTLLAVLGCIYGASFFQVIFMQIQTSTVFGLAPIWLRSTDGKQGIYVITHPPIIRCWPTGRPVGQQVGVLGQWVGLGE